MVAGWTTGLSYVFADTLFTQGTEESSRIAVAHAPVLPLTGRGPPTVRWIAIRQRELAVQPERKPCAEFNISLSRPVAEHRFDVTDSLSLNMSPVWMPGHQAILFISDKDGGRDIYQLNLASSGRAQWTSRQGHHRSQSRSHRPVVQTASGWRGRSTARPPTSGVFRFPRRIPYRFPKLTQVTTGDQTIETAMVSGDGKWLYYDSDLRGNADIWRVSLADGVAAGPPEQITSDPAAEFDPSVSPDGKEVAFHSFRTGNRDIFIVPFIGRCRGPGDDQPRAGLESTLVSGRQMPSYSTSS